MSALDACPILKRVPGATGTRFSRIRPAKTFGPDDVATDADGDRQPRQILLDEIRTGELSPLFHRANPLLRWRGTA